MFGREAAKLLDYVECFPEGFRKGTKMIKACTDVGIEGFPTWVINGQVWNQYAVNRTAEPFLLCQNLFNHIRHFLQVLNGEQELSELAQVSGFNEYVQPS